MYSNKIKVLLPEVEDPKVLVVTPLLPGHVVSKKTKKSMKRNDIPFMWITSEGENNIPINLENGLNWYEKRFGSLPDYYMMIDRDIIAGRHLIDKLYNHLSKKHSKMVKEIHAYAYASFEFKGYVNAKFPAIPFDPIRLLQGNYISSNSLFYTPVAREVGLVKDEKYKRLLDWAFLLKLLDNGYIGLNCPDASFVAMSTDKDISAGSQDDYRIKHQRVHEDFVLPVVKHYSQ